MSESYTIGGDTLQKILEGNETAQSFIPEVDHLLSYFDLEVYLNSEVGIPVPHLYNSDPTFIPVGGTASHCTNIVYSKPFKKGLQRIRCYMEPYLLEAGQVYLIKIYGLGTETKHTFYWQYDKGDATYPRGHRIFRASEAHGWTHYWNDDYMFVEAGTPPVPPSPPLAPVPNFSVLDCVASYCEPIVTVKLPTNAPCHLTLYWTDKKPLKHHLTRIVRGLAVPWGVYFCFVGWHAIEQIEEGDTVFHTFIIPDWPPGKLRWYTFRGDIDTILSASVGPILDYIPFWSPPFQNPSFEEWSPDLAYPLYWQKWWDGYGWRAWLRDENRVKEGWFSAQLIAHGDDMSTGLRQFVCPHIYKGKTVRFTLNFFTSPRCNGGYYIVEHGPHSWGTGAMFYSFLGWNSKRFTHKINESATSIEIGFYTKGWLAYPGDIHWDDFSMKLV